MTPNRENHYHHAHDVVLRGLPAWMVAVGVLTFSLATLAEVVMRYAS